MKYKFSVLVPVYFNEKNISSTVAHLKKLQDLLPEWELEFVFVDDGSGDKSFQLLEEEHKKDKRVKIVKLSKNFGSMLAIQAGLEYVSGDCVGIISADLQDPPELFIPMIEKWKDGRKIVLAVRKDREESFSQKVIANTFYNLMAKYAIKDYPPGGFDFVLVDRKVVDDLKQIREKNTNIMSLIFWLGYDRDTIEYTRRKRTVGKSRWTLAKKIKLFIDSFVSFSYFPIRAISAIGLTTATCSLCYGIFVAINALLGRITVAGFASMMIIITFLLGLVMIMMGIVGEYLWRILDEVRKRPPFIVEDVIK